MENIASTSKESSNQTMANQTPRRSKRLAARLEDKQSNSLVKMARLDLKKEPAQKKRENIFKKPDSDRKITLFDCGLKATKIIGSAYVDDMGTDKLCYLVKFENEQFELILSTLAHEYCPMV